MSASTSVVLSQKALAAIVAACLAVGSGGNWALNRASQAQAEIAPMVYASIGDVAALSTRVAVTESQNAEIKRRLDSIEMKLDALLARQ